MFAMGTTSTCFSCSPRASQRTANPPWSDRGRSTTHVTPPAAADLVAFEMDSGPFSTSNRHAFKSTSPGATTAALKSNGAP